MKFNTSLVFSILSIILVLYLTFNSIKEGFTSEQDYLKEQEDYFDARQRSGLSLNKDADTFYEYDNIDQKLKIHKPNVLGANAASYNPIDEKVQRCKNITSCEQIDNTDCGYCFFTDEFYYGNKNGPKTDVCPGGWVFTNEACKERRERAICDKVTSCHNMIGDAAVCAWCPTKNKAFVYKKENGKIVPKYKKDICIDEDIESGKDLGLVLQKDCAAFEKDHPCIGPNESTGPHSIECLEHLWKQGGCSTNGTAAPRNNAGERSYWNKRGWKAVLSDMKAWFSDANGKNGWNNVKGHHKGCYGTDPDPCNPKYGGTLECYQKKFLKNGCTKDGHAYPNKKPDVSITEWKKLVEEYRKFGNDVNAPYSKRNSNYEKCYGKTLQKPKGTTGASLHPDDFILYGRWIGGDNKNKPVDKIITEGDRYVFISQRGSDVKIVKTDAQLNNQKGSYFAGKIDQYGTKPTRNAPQGAYIIRLKKNTVYKGCYKDKPGRAMTNLRKNMTYDDAVKYVREKGYKYMGLQDTNAYGGKLAQVFGSNDDEYSKYGKASNCNKMNTGEFGGGSWANSVYELN